MKLLRLRSASVIAATALSACGGLGDERSPAGGGEESAPAKGAEPSPSSTAAAEFNPRLLRRFQPLRERLDETAVSKEEIALGRRLFFDKRLSKDTDLSCNSCHKLDRYGVDGERTSLGTNGQRGGRNSPTVYNAGGHFTQFWDGRSGTLEEQAKGPILNAVEMGMPDDKSVVRRLKAIPGYVDAFTKAFPKDRDPLTFDNVGHAIGAFERGLTTPSRWDSYLKGDKAALRPQELAGLKVFTNVGCMVCHTGEFLGGTSYQRAGAVEPWPNQDDAGRFQATKNPADRMMFKVPSLRNVVRTAPYFHDGSAATLTDAVRMMGKHQLGVELSKDEVAAIVAWFESLTGELPSSYVEEPEPFPSAEGEPT